MHPEFTFTNITIIVVVDVIAVLLQKLFSPFLCVGYTQWLPCKGDCMKEVGERATLQWELDTVSAGRSKSTSTVVSYIDIMYLPYDGMKMALSSMTFLPKPLQSNQEWIIRQISVRGTLHQISNEYSPKLWSHHKQGQSEKQSQTRGAYRDRATKCNVASWMGSWSRKGH